MHKAENYNNELTQNNIFYCKKVSPVASAVFKATWLGAAPGLGVLERWWPLCLFPDAERTLRRWIPDAFKNATINGCLFWGPLLPTRPALLGFILSPTEGNSELHDDFNIHILLMSYHFVPVVCFWCPEQHWSALMFLTFSKMSQMKGKHISLKLHDDE